MKKVLLLLLLGFVTTQNYAQSDSSKHITGGVIQYTRSGFWIRKVNYTIGGVPASGKEVVIKLMSYPASAKEDNIAAHYNTLAWCAFGAVCASLATSLITNDSQNSFHTQSSKVFLGIGVGLIIPEWIFSGQRNHHFKKSLALYNQQFSK